MGEAPLRAHRYRFGPRDRRGLVAGVRPGQAALVAVGLTAGVAWLRSSTGMLRGLGAFGTVLVAVVVAFWPLAGRTLDQWVPVVLRYAASALSGRRRDVVPLVRRGARRPAVGFSGMSITSIDLGNRRIGAIEDRAHQTVTVVTSVECQSFALLGDEDRARLVENWAGLLSATATGSEPPYRLQWIERTVPERAEQLWEAIDRSFGDWAGRVVAGSARPRLDGAVAERNDALRGARASYSQLVAEESATALRHEVFVALTMRGARRRVRTPAAPEATEPLLAGLLAFEDRARRAGLSVEGLLSPAGLRALVRRAIEPPGPPGTGAGRLRTNPWPLAVDEHWSQVRVDGTWHASYWIAEWPRSEVGSDFLLPLLLERGVRRSATVVMAPIPPVRAVRAAEHARTEVVADRELRRRHGFALTARSVREHDAVLRREDELAEGHAAYRFSGYLTVTADVESELARSCARVEQAAALARLELRRLYGNQLEAFLCSLPLGRGCA